MTTNPIAGNQSYTGVSNAAEQFTELNTSNLKVSKELTLGGGYEVSVSNLADSEQLTVSPSDSRVFCVNNLSRDTVLTLGPAEVGAKLTFIFCGNLSGNLLVSTAENDRMTGWTNQLDTVESFANASVMRFDTSTPPGTTMSMLAIPNDDSGFGVWMTTATCSSRSMAPN